MNNFKIQFNDIESAMRAAKMFELRKQVSISIMEGKCRQARAAQKEFAKIAVSDFDTFTKLPNINITGFPLKMYFPLLLRTIKFNIFRKFSKTTPEEKQLAKQYRNYAKTLTKEDIKNKTLDITIPRFY